MSRSYLFFEPAQLPLTSDLLSGDTVRSFTDAARVRAILSAALPGLAWDPSPEGALATASVVADGAQYEFAIHPTPASSSAGATAEEPAALTVGLRASGRVDSAPFVQRLCDATGWLAFDERPLCFQPNRPPMPA